jgi:ATP-binding cassette subfamily B protein
VRPTDLRFDGQHPVRTTLRLLAPYRWRVLGATLAFVVKDSPIWVLPVLTANIIDVVVQHGPVSRLWINASVLFAVLLQNIPTHMLWVRLSSRTIRTLGARLRSALTQHLQQLSIGYHNRTGAALLQAKVVRDVENVEQMLQQVSSAGTSGPGPASRPC